jgi:hypothetical protein
METSLDRIIAGVQDSLNNPPGFANHLNSVYMAIEEAIDRHQVFVSLHEEARLVTRQTLVLPSGATTRGLPTNVGNLRELRLKPETDRMRQWGYSPIDLVPLSRLHQFQAQNTLAGQAQNYPPVLAAQWTDAATGKTSVEFSHACSFDVPLEIVFEPSNSSQLDPERPPQYLKSFYFLLKAEVARDLLPKFDFDDRTYKRLLEVIEKRLAEGNGLLSAYLVQNDAEAGGMAESWGSFRMRRTWR